MTATNLVLILIALTAPVAPAWSTNPMSELEALGYLQMALQQPLGTGFAPQPPTAPPIPISSNKPQ